jgi:hypothetical protein
MRAVSFLLSTAIGLSVLGCHDTTAPPSQTLREIFQIRVPASAAATDSIHIAFAANTVSCDDGVTVSSTMNDTGMTFSVSVAAGASCQSGYAPGVYIQPQYTYVVVPPHPVPFTVGFAEPGQPDSVRVVAAP